MLTSEINSTINRQIVQIVSGDKTYPAYLAAPRPGGKTSTALVLLHSFKGLEPGYKVMMDNLASEGFIVLAPEWQTFTEKPKDEAVKQLVIDSVMHLKNGSGVDSARVGLVGFCAGGRFTMLFLPQISLFKAGVAFYGFPYSGGFNNQSQPAEFLQQLEEPLLMIHGSRDKASNIVDIYKYAQGLDAANKFFEMKVYQGEPHGFMVVDGKLSETSVAKDDFWQMVTFFNRTLK